MCGLNFTCLEWVVLFFKSHRHDNLIDMGVAGCSLGAALS